ncbi:phytoene/squalene synthase family protein [bacterium]|jgi:15-cis-phytoene synthase|nr:phytoene/squalene synthase family protein [Planctomicrobium sp.]MDA7503937.1 phytoene/squalene synthase family protein [bacterium]
MSDRDKDIDAAYRYCVKLARGSGSNFFFAFYSLPKQMFREMCALYAYMRITDDMGDDVSVSPTERTENLTVWREKLRASHQGQTVSNPVLVAMVDVAHKRDITLDVLEEVINGVESDLTHVQFQTFDELNSYCYQVAGVVGICCLKVWGCDFSKSEIQQQAIDCGTAFQLTNILRDLGEDAQRGRLYIPNEEMKRFKLTKDDFSNGVVNESFREFMRFQVERAWSYYRKAIPLLDNVSPTGKPILSGFFQAYSSLMREIEQRDYDVFSSRVRLSKLKKANIVFNSVLRNSPTVKIPENVLPDT